MDELTTIIEGNTSYKIYADSMPVIGEDFDYDDEEENKAYWKRFESGELQAYYIEKLEPCSCCTSWIVVDSLGGIHAVDIHGALDTFKHNQEGDCE